MIKWTKHSVILTHCHQNETKIELNALLQISIVPKTIFFNQIRLLTQFHYSHFSFAKIQEIINSITLTHTNTPVLFISRIPLLHFCHTQYKIQNTKCNKIQQRTERSYSTLFITKPHFLTVRESKSNSLNSKRETHTYETHSHSRTLNQYHYYTTRISRTNSTQIENKHTHTNNNILPYKTNT